MKTSELKSEIKDYIYEILSEDAASDTKKAKEAQTKAFRAQIDALKTQLASFNNPNNQISSGNPQKDAQVKNTKQEAIRAQIKALESRLQVLNKPGTQPQALTEEEETLDEAKKDKIKEAIKKIKMMKEGDDKKQKVAALKNIVGKLKK